MQFHIDGFRPGDPQIQPAASPATHSPGHSSLRPEVDVLIVGSGPAGLTLAAQLAAFADIDTLLVEQNAGPLERGRADGIACRSMEMFNAFGFAERLMKEAYWVNETTFWKPDADQPQNIVRSGRVQDVEDGLSEFPHVILNQARVHDYYLELMQHSPTRLSPVYSQRLCRLQYDPDTADARIHATFQSTSDNAAATKSVSARYVVGCDGARSTVREAIAQPLRGDSANQAWGVMDVLLVTDFPDIRMKSLIQSASEGSIVVIPREGGFLVRLYVELGKLNKHERVSARSITVEQLIAAASRIFHPYQLQIKEVAWWSVYEIAQRLCDRFDDVPEAQKTQRNPRIFIAGDACHTHSPKAGQGMNVSMRDAFNLGWKLAAVLRGQCDKSLLRSYTDERQKVAKTLIDFDREWSQIIASRNSATGQQPSSPADTARFQSYFTQSARYTAGTAIQYQQSSIVGADTHQQLASGFDIGMRFHSAPVIRVADGRPMHLGHTIIADGRWRLIGFADNSDPADSSSALHQLCDYLQYDPRSPVLQFTPSGSDIDSLLDFRAVFQPHFRDIDIHQLPALLRPQKGRYQLTDYEKIFAADSASDVFDLRGVDRQRGCLVIVRPDQHIAQVLPLRAGDAISAFFSAFMRPAQLRA